MSVIYQTCTKFVYIALLREEIFYPVWEDNQNSAILVDNLAGIATEDFLDELRNTKEATHKYLSTSESQFSYKRFPGSIKKDMIGKITTNYHTEISFAGLTSHIKKVLADKYIECSGSQWHETWQFFNREGKVGIFHKFAEGIQILLIQVPMEDVPSSCKCNDFLLKRQCEG